LSVQPGVPRGADSNRLLQASVPVATDGVVESPALRAIAEGATAGLIRTAATVPFLQGGISGVRGDTAQQDQDFQRYEHLRDLADRMQGEARQANSGASRIGNILGFAPSLISAPTLALNIATQGVDPAAREVAQEGNLGKAYGLLGVGAGGGALQAALPASVGASPLVRALTGGLLGTATGTGSQEAQHLIAPNVVAAPTSEDALVNAGLGSLLGVALGRSPVAPTAAGGEARLSPDPLPASLPSPAAPSESLPRGADFRGEFTTKPDNTPPPVGTVRVDVAGNAVTPAQGAQTLADAIVAGARPAAALPEPVIAVDRAGRASTTVDQNAALQAPSQGASDTLGLTDALRALVARDPRAAREGAPIATPALPAPAVAVDRAGTAMTSADFLARARQAQSEAEARQAAQQERRRLGITPDIERTQGGRWKAADAETSALADRMVVDDARRAGMLSDAEHPNAPGNERPLPGKDLTLPDDRVLAESMRREIGWDQVGGRLLRQVDTGGEKPEVVGRTPWVGKPGTDGESNFWRMRPEVGGRISEQGAHAALDKFAAGEKLNAKERRFVEYATQTARGYELARRRAEDEFAQDQRDMDAEQRAAASRSLVKHGAEFQSADDGDAMTLAQWVRRAHDAGVPAEQIIDATWDGAPAEQTRRLVQHITDAEARHGTDAGTTPIHREGGAGADRGRPPTAGSEVAEPTETYRLEGGPAGAEATRPVTSQRGLFAESTAAERNRAALEASDAQRNGLGRDLVRPEQGAGELFAGDRPAQESIPAGRGANLRRFMAGSKVVDARGRPLTVYHGTAEEFDVFGAHHAGGATGHATSPLGHFFTENHAQARHYAENASGGVPAEERVVDAYLSIKHPTEWTLGHLQRIDSPEEALRVRRNLEKSGFDGIHIKDAGQWIAFHPEQIKSASENRGTFDPAHPDIRFSRDTRGEPQRSTGDGQDEASGIPAGLPIDATAETQALSRALGRWVGAEGDDRAPARFGAVRPDSLPDAVAQAIDAFGQATGTRIVLVRNLTPEVDTFNGVRLPELPGVLFVDESAEHPFITVAAHEFTHQLEQDNPALWQEIADEVRRQGRLEAYQENLRQRGYRNVDEDLAVRELLGDAVGDAFADPEFLEDLARHNPGVFQRVAQAFKDFLDRLISRIRDLGSSRYLKDVQVFRDKLVDVMARYRPEFEQPPGHRPLAEGEPQFSRRPGSENDHLRDMLSRRPGESQADYTNRVLRKNKDEIKQAVELAKLQRVIGRQELRAMWAKQARAADIADYAFNEARKMFDLAGDAPNLQSIDEWENGRIVTSVEARQFFAQMRDAFDQRIERIHALAPGALQNLIEFYFPHLWEDSAKAAKWYQGLTAKRPLEGGKAFLKQRTWGTIKEGMASGLKPVSTNPVDLVMLKLGQMDKFIAFNEFRKNLQERGWLRRLQAGERVPLGYARVDDPAFQVAGGLQGYYAVPELIAKDINNYLSPSLYRHGWWKALRVVQNALMSARLGWSMFHAGFTTTDNLVMHADVAARRFLAGDVAGGLGTLLKTPLTVVWSPIEGHRLNRQWLGLAPADNHTAAVLDMLEQGGARRSMSLTEYDRALPAFIRAIRRRAAGDLVKHALPAVGEASSWIIHHWLVPNQKMAARVMLAKFELDRMAGLLGKRRGDYAGIIDAMHPDVVKQIAGKVAGLVDDRLGQMNYDNQFWNKTAREIAQAVIGAVGWQVGTVRTVTGGVRDLSHLWSPPQLLATLDKAGKITDAHLGHVSGRLTYLISLGLLMGALGAITQYLLTGEGPGEVKDYFFPKTGRKNDDGSDERLQFPSYWQDHYKLATHPLQTAEHKIHPSIGMFMEAIANQDYYGVRIRDEDASWWKQAEQVGEYVAKGFLPYSWTGHQKLEQNHDSAARKVANFFGVTTAPASVSRTPFQAFVAEKAYAAMPQGARTPEQAEHSQQMHTIEAAMRRGEQPDLSGLSTRDQRNALRASRDEVPAIRFRRLGIEDKLRAYELATPRERDEYHLRDIILRSNWHKVVRDLPDADREAVLAKIQALIP
jgi:hypothetical protein